MHAVGLADFEVRAAQNGSQVAACLAGSGLVLRGVVGEHDVATLVAHHDGIPGVLRGGELQVHRDLVGVAFGPVHGGAQCHDGAAVDVGAHVGVQPRVRAGIGHGDDRAAVDDEEAVRVDAVALVAQAGHDVEGATVDRGDGDTVLVGVDAVVLRGDGDVAAVEREVQL